MPSVSIHAPVLRAAVIRPLLKAWLTFGGRVKFSEPPWTVSRSLGLSICHSLNISWSNTSGFVSTAIRTYWGRTDVELTGTEKLMVVVQTRQRSGLFALSIHSRSNIYLHSRSDPVQKMALSDI